jgi:hypothetical protein
MRELNASAEIFKKLSENNYPLASNPVFGKRQGILAVEEYKRCDALLGKKCTLTQKPGFARVMEMYNLFNKTMQAIQVKEEKIKPELIEIAEEITRDVYQIPSHISFNAKIKNVEEITMKSLPLQKATSPEFKTKFLQDEIQKRIILNGLAHGSSMHVWKSFHYAASEKINKLDSELISLYDTHSAVMGYLNWCAFIPKEYEVMIKQNVSAYAATHGKEQVIFKQAGKPEAEIKIEAINFPVLLHEMNKGVIDYLISTGIPKDLTPEELKFYYSEADSYEKEIWMYYLAPSLWVRLLKKLNVEAHELPQHISAIAKMPLEELTTFMNSL